MNTKISDLFDENGKCIKDIHEYFDPKNGDLIEYELIGEEYHKYPSDSDIVQMYYADFFSGIICGVAADYYYQGFV